MADRAFAFTAADRYVVTDLAPTDPTDVIPTTGASFTYTTSSDTIASSIDPSINNLLCLTTRDIGHSTTGNLIPWILMPGWLQGGNIFAAAMKQRIASLVNLTNGRAPFVITGNTRGRGALGTIDYRRDTYDWYDILQKALAVGGSNVNGTSAVVLGYSTGAHSALAFASRFPDRTRAVVLYWPNYDLGKTLQPYAPGQVNGDSYWGLRTDVRATIDSQLGARSPAGAATLDSYITHDVVGSIAQILALRDGPHVWLLGDLNDPEPLTSRQRIRDAIQGMPGARQKLHVHLTQTGDANRILHSDFVSGDVTAGSLFAERYFTTRCLEAPEWTMPTRLATAVRLLGYMKTRDFEIWLGPTGTPKLSSSGGLTHTADLLYDVTDQRYIVRPITSTNGFAEVFRGTQDYVQAAPAALATTVDLDVVQSLTTLASLGFQHEWASDAGMNVGGGLVTSFTDQIGAQTLAPTAGNEPTTGTDADAIVYCQFTATSPTVGKEVHANALVYDPNQDFVDVYVVNPQAANQAMGAQGHVGTAITNMFADSAAGISVALVDDTGAGVSINVAGFTLNAKHVVVVRRESNVLLANVDGGAWTSIAITAGSPTYTSPKFAWGAEWANGVGNYAFFATARSYLRATKQGVISNEQATSLVNYLKTRFVVP